LKTQTTRKRTLPPETATAFSLTADLCPCVLSSPSRRKCHGSRSASPGRNSFLTERAARYREKEQWDGTGVHITKKQLGERVTVAGRSPKSAATTRQGSPARKATSMVVQIEASKTYTQKSQKEDGSRSICYVKRPKVSRTKGGSPHQDAAPKSSPEVATGSVPLASTTLFPGENESPRPGAHAKTHPDVRLVDEHTRSSAQHKQRKLPVAEKSQPGIPVMGLMPTSPTNSFPGAPKQKGENRAPRSIPGTSSSH
jgi:hypothetical protein